MSPIWILLNFLQYGPRCSKAGLPRYSLFGLTRKAIKHHGRQCQEFTKLAIVVLNQVIRPFTAKWHRLLQQGAFENAERCWEFRTELEEQQAKLREYTRMLGALAGVEDLTSLEAPETTGHKAGA